MAADSEIGVGIRVDASGADSGANQAAAAIQQAATSINENLARIVTSSNSTAAAIRSGFAGIEGQLNSLASGAEGAANRTERAFNRIRHSGTAVRREMIVLAHEAVTGNWRRFGGSLLVLAERWDLLSKLTGPVGVGLGVVAAAIGATVVAAIEGAVEFRKFENELVLTGNAAGLTAQKWLDMGNAIEAANAKITAGQARGAVTAVAGTGVFGPRAVQAVATAVAEIARLSGQTEEKVAGDFAKMEEGVFKWATTAKEARDTVSAADAEYARQLEETGHKEEAEIFLAQRISDRLHQVADDLGQMPTFWDNVRRAASDAWDAMMGIGRPDTLEQQIAKLKQQRDILAGGTGIATTEGEALVASGGLFGTSPGELDAQIRKLEAAKKAQDEKAAADAKQAQANREGKAASAALDEEIKKMKDRNLVEELWNKHLAEEEKSRANGGTVFTEAQEKAYRAYLERTYNNHQAKPKTLGAAGAFADEHAADTGELAIIKDKLRFEEQELQRSYKANEITLKDYYARRLQIVQEGMDAELAVAQKEVTAAQNAARYAQSPNEKAQSAARITTAQNRVALLKQQEREQLLQLNEQEEAEAQNHANKMAEIDLQAQEKVILQRLKQQETIAQAEVAMGQRSKSQAVNTEIATENARYVAQMDYYQKVSALQGLSQEKLEQLKAQEEELEQQHQEKLLQIVSKGAEEQAKPQQQMLQQVEGDFSSFFANVISGTQTFKQAAISLYMGLGRQITEVMTKRFVNDLLGGANAPNAGAGGIGGIGGILQKGIGYLFGTEQGGGPQTIAAQMVTAQNTTAMQAAQVTVASMTVASMVGAGGTGGGGLAGLLGGLGGGSMGGDFGFTATGVAASSAAVGDGLLAQTASTGGSASALMGLSGGFAAYAKGTNYVPETGLAMLHRGEAVVPAAYNNSRTNMSARIQNNFYLPQHYDMRTQGQVAAAAGGAISAALKRNR